ncbi:hypothetical protein MKJ04_00740 [Pontibacter sp. E15-1]|uniref:hypothetical protein n=1 Tax=Pontibacter sp. E15-1 TaxID=2919918 RepID=UPI001F4F5B27|nr:hypothetical protein [Pontibacter sp. E15-1]MCJ8163349.1 hypothetical protein [Pontibacter sp. E15-1]
MACQTSTTTDKNPEVATATLLWTGELAADGCGFEVLLDGRKYLPENEDAIDARYKANARTEVELTFERLPDPIDRRCGMVPQPRVMDAIRIISIRPR